RRPTMQPLPETTAALTALARGSGSRGGELVEKFTAAAEMTGRIAPECVGITLTYLREGVSFTWVATALEAATLDAVQYVDGGPCLTAVEDGDVVMDADLGPLDERRWRTFAAASARFGVQSTLSIPLLDRHGDVYGGVNLYGGTSGTFEGVHDELAQQFGGWAGGAVTNADLAFTTMARSEHAPHVLRDAAVGHQAVGMIMAAHEVDEATARHRLSDAAARAGVSETEVAQVLVTTHLL
ncbi:MAG TPA: ANTAR domain-containing protein, partial [Ornithinibacter sp.]|nr:ANTAR domain-containing protein [Ornithinibacter sp.]